MRSLAPSSTAPSSAESSSTPPVSGPASIRARCGVISATNPIGPPAETATATEGGPDGDQRGAAGLGAQTEAAGRVVAELEGAEVAGQPQPGRQQRREHDHIAPPGGVQRAGGPQHRGGDPLDRVEDEQQRGQPSKGRIDPDADQHQALTADAVAPGEQVDRERSDHRPGERTDRQQRGRPSDDDEVDRDESSWSGCWSCCWPTG